jgi:hypothetical protein
VSVKRESVEAKVNADVGAQLKFEVRFLNALTRSGRRVGGGGGQSRHCRACRMRARKRPPLNRAVLRRHLDIPNMSYGIGQDCVNS